jgi:hypothetical protein
MKMGADDERQAGLLGLGMCTHDAGQRAFVSDPQREVPELHGAQDQLLGMRRPLQEREV